MNSWDIVNEQVERSRIKRHPWKEILGMTLTEKVTECRNKGWTLNMTKEYLLAEKRVRVYLLDNATHAGEAIKALEIGIASRFAEQEMMEKRRRRW